MQFRYTIKEQLAPLAWCACVEKGSDTVELIHGQSVECKENFFVAGVWDGEFQKGAFDSAHFACCTGGNVNNCKMGGGEIYNSQSYTR